MSGNPRQFEAVDPFGRAWRVEFRWQQNAISIRHADDVDCRYYLTSDAGRRELVVALPLLALEQAARARQRGVSDAWVMRLGAFHARALIESGRAADCSLVRVSLDEVERLSEKVEATAARGRDW